MQRLVSSLLLFTILLQACADNGQKADIPIKETISKSSDTSLTKNFAYQAEQYQLHRKKDLCRQLALYDIEEDTQDFELRMWLFPSMWDPSILYVLKKNNASWTLFHYQFYTFLSKDPNCYDHSVIDSVVMESVRPQTTTWTAYIENLKVDSLWNMQTESAIKGKSFGMNDGHAYLLEFTQKGQYKYLYYTTPEYFQNREINHKNFILFKKRLVDPIIYKGMRNP